MQDDRLKLLEFESMLGPLEDKTNKSMRRGDSKLLTFINVETDVQFEREVWAGESLRTTKRRLWDLSSGGSRAAAGVDTWLFGGTVLSNGVFEEEVDDGATIHIQRPESHVRNEVTSYYLSDLIPEPPRARAMSLPTGAPRVRFSGLYRVSDTEKSLDR